MKKRPSVKFSAPLAIAVLAVAAMPVRASLAAVKARVRPAALPGLALGALPGLALPRFQRSGLFGIATITLVPERGQSGVLAGRDLVIVLDRALRREWKKHPGVPLRNLKNREGLKIYLGERK